MTEREPKREPMLFKKWKNGYASQRQVMASAVIFKNQGWNKWQIGHAKLYGILLWHYEKEKQTTFKYSKTLKIQGYRRTHNYRLLRTILEEELLQKEGNGYYSFAPSKIKIIEKVLMIFKELDMIGNKKEVE